MGVQACALPISRRSASSQVHILSFITDRRGELICGGPRWGSPASAEFRGTDTITGDKQKFSAPPPVADINVTPMVDVMLVMLIIFMVITPMLSKGVTVELVKTNHPIAMQAADKSDAIVCAVTRE